MANAMLSGDTRQVEVATEVAALRAQEVAATPEREHDRPETRYRCTECEFEG